MKDAASELAHRGDRVQSPARQMGPPDYISFCVFFFKGILPVGVLVFFKVIKYFSDKLRIWACLFLIKVALRINRLLFLFSGQILKNHDQKTFPYSSAQLI